MDFTAHIRESDGMEQSVTEHCRNVAALAESYGESVGLGKLARLQGIFHDAGKLNRDFYAYIHGDSRFHRGEIDHCYAGAKYLCAFSDRHFPDQEMPYRTSRLIARTILSHHGLHDWLTESGDDYFRIRNAKVERYEEIEPNLDAMLAEMGYSEASLKALLEKQKYPILLDAQESMTGDYHEDFSVFQRTKLEYLTDSYDNAQAANFCWEQFKVHRSVLMVVNTRKTAADLYRRLKERVEDGEENVHLIHLSTNMCPAHRENAIREMRKYLQDGESVICVTTQLIEAGVDISFGCVVRSKAGLSNAAQAAGRCNRHGEMRKICPVYLMKLTEENIDRLKEIVSAQYVTSAVWDSLCMQQKEKETDLLSVETLSQYFQKLYQENQKELSFPQSENDQDLLKLLSTDSKRAELGKGNRSKYDKFSLQAFATAGKAFHVIEDAGESVIVPYDEDAGQMIRDLNGDLEFGQMQKLLRSVQKYTVSVYAGDKRKLAEAGALCPLHCGALALEENFYDKTALGLLTEGQERPFLDL